MPSEKTAPDTDIALVLPENAGTPNACCIRTVHFRRLVFVRIWFNNLFNVVFSAKSGVKPQ